MKKRLSRLQKTTSQKKSKNWDFSKGDSPWSWSKIINCSILFIFDKMSNENLFHNTVQRKTSFKDCKNSNWKKSKNWDFFVHCFGQKLAIFPVFILVEIGKKHVVYGILDRKNAFVDNRKKK